MTNRLPIPTATIKEIQKLIEENQNNLWVKNPLKNILRDICGYDYPDAIERLNFLSSDHPTLMNYTKHIAAIKNAQKRYDKI